jgi:hypothetical protein
MNPYTPSSSKLFYGREQLIRDVLADEQQGQSTVLIGGRRCGKTTILRRVKDYLRGLGSGAADAGLLWQTLVPDASSPGPSMANPIHWPFFIDLQGLSPERLSDVYDHIAGALARGLPPKVRPLSAPPPGCSGDTLDRWLAEVDQRLAEVGLGGIALLIDEIEDLFDKSWRHDLMSFFRRIDGKINSRIWILICGSAPLHRYENPSDGSPPLNSARRVFVPDLGYSARRRMIVEPFTSSGRLPPSDSVTRRVDCLVGGQVWILTLLLEQLFKRGTEDAGEVERIAQDIMVDYLHPPFERWRRNFDDETWKLYAYIAQEEIVASSYFQKMDRQLRRQLLEFHGLVHRQKSGSSALGPRLFRQWAEDMNLIQGPFNPTRKAVGGDDDDLPPGYWRYDVALSYAGPQRAIATQLAELLRKQSKRVFFDQELSYDLWGQDLARCLPQAYDRNARITVLLVSDEYVTRRWPKVEAAAALAKAIREGWKAVLTVSVDGSRLPDVPDSIVLMNLADGKQSIADVALALVAKLQ